MAKGLTSAPPEPRINAAQRRLINQGKMQPPQMQPQRVNAAERRLINQGQMQAPQGYQGGGQRPPMPQQMPTQAPPTGGPSQIQPMPRPNWMNNIPSQKLDPMLPNGQPRQPGDPNRYSMGPNGEMYGTLIGWNQNNSPNWGQNWGQMMPQAQPPGIQYNGGSQQQPQFNPQQIGQAFAPYMKRFF